MNGTGRSLLRKDFIRGNTKHGPSDVPLIRAELRSSFDEVNSLSIFQDSKFNKHIN